MKKRFTLATFFVFISHFIFSQSPVSFNPDNTFGCTPIGINFYNTSTIGVTYDFSYGDGNYDFGVIDGYHQYDYAGTYTVTLEAFDGAMTSLGTYQQDVTIEGPSSYIQTNYEITCPSQIIGFFSPNPGTEYTWDFGDGNQITSSDYYVEHTYFTSNIYYISMSYFSSPCGQTYTTYDSIEIDATLPYFGSFPGMGVSSTNLCPGETTNAYVNGGPYQSYSWDFGDGNFSSDPYPNFAYPATGVYTVSVNLINGCGIDTTLYENISVDNSIPAPTVTIDGPTEVCIGASFNLNIFTSSPDLIYTWDFGDATTPLITSDNYSYHTYSNGGTYIVELTVENLCGNTSSVFYTIDATTTAPIVNPYFQIYPQTVCPGDEVQFWTNNDYDYYIDFGDGAGTAVEYSHSYNVPGVYPISVILQNTCGSSYVLYDTVYVQMGLPVTGNLYFDAYPNPACPNSDVEFYAEYGFSDYTWDFGDGYTSSYQEVNHPYLYEGDYNVSVTITNGCGSDTTLYSLIQIVPNLPIDELDWIVFAEQACTGSTVYMSVDNTDELDVLWDFGDGSTSTDLLTSHVYDIPGNYIITLTAVNACGNDSTVTHAITISNSVVPDLAGINFAIQTPGCIGDNLYFAVIPAGVGTYSWDFGDGNNGMSDQLLYVEGQPFEVGFHAYTAAGAYNATLTITNACGNSIDTTILVTIGGIGSGVPADVSFWLSDLDVVCEGQPVEFFSVGAGTYIWDFGDGTGNLITYSSLTPVEHIYNDHGGFVVTVIGLNACGGFEAQSENIFIPDSKIDVITNTVQDSDCGVNNGVAIVSATGGTQPYSYSWTNGDESVFADSLGSGIYVVTVTDNNGCSTEAISAVSDEQGPVILLQNIVHNECYGQDNGIVSVSVLGGAPPYTIVWSNGEVSQDIFGLEAGPYEIFITDANGCFASSSFTIEQPEKSIVSVFTQSADCGSNNGQAAAAISNGVLPFNFIWPNTTGSSDETGGLAPGVYEVFVIDGNTCLLQQNFVINETNGPIIITDSITDATCSGNLSAIYINTIGGTSPFNYDWSNGTTNQDLTNVLPGEYNVEVEGSDGCSSFMFFNVEMSAPDETAICIVTVDTLTSSNIIVWNPVFSPDVVSYNIYKESSQSGLYYLVGNQSSDSISQYYDYTSNPAIRSWRYKVAAVDDCGNEAELSDPHKTMHLTSNLGVGGVVNLIWDHYNGFDYDTYYINRYHPSTGWMVIDSVGSLNISYTDLTPPSDSNLVYIVEIFPPSICTASKAQDHNSSRSNKTGINAPLEFDDSSVGENANNDFSIYPNPTSGIVQILYSSIITEVKVFDLSGQLVYQNANSTTGLKIDFSDFADGIYMVQLTTLNGPVYSKIVKQ